MRNARHTAVAVMGLDAMGASLARAFMAKNGNVNVWNRTPERMSALLAEGATPMATAVEAFETSRLIVMCTTDKRAAGDVLRRSDVIGALEGRTVVNLSTGSVADARDIAAHVARHGGKYIDGGIMGYPRDIGKTSTVMLYGGDVSAYETHRDTLAALGGNMRFLGADPGVVPNAYLALYAYYFGCVASFFEGAHWPSARAWISRNS